MPPFCKCKSNLSTVSNPSPAGLRLWLTANPVFLLFAVLFEPCIGPDVNALLLVRIDLAPPLEGVATGAVPLLLGALAHRAEVGQSSSFPGLKGSRD